jgi:hypothetical protein
MCDDAAIRHQFQLAVYKLHTSILLERYKQKVCVEQREHEVHCSTHLVVGVLRCLIKCQTVVLARETKCSVVCCNAYHRQVCYDSSSRFRSWPLSQQCNEQSRRGRRWRWWIRLLAAALQRNSSCYICHQIGHSFAVKPCNLARLVTEGFHVLQLSTVV